MKDNQIKDTSVFLMIFTALCFDGLQALIGWIPVFGNVLAGLFNIFAFLTFFLWFKMYGIKMMTPKRIVTMVGAGVIEMIPFINILPAWTFAVIYLIGTTKIKELVKKHPTITKGVINVGQKIESKEKREESGNIHLVSK